MSCFMSCSASLLQIEMRHKTVCLGLPRFLPNRTRTPYHARYVLAAVRGWYAVRARSRVLSGRPQLRLDRAADGRLRRGKARLLMDAVTMGLNYIHTNVVRTLSMMWVDNRTVA